MKTKLYKQDHLIAKLIVATIVSVLITAAQLLELPLSLVLNILAIFTWFFGVNAVAHVIETIRKHPHRHDKV